MGYLRVVDLGKAYKRYPNNRARLLEWLNPSCRRHQAYWALRGISFDVEPGEAVGIVGNNGAGKSTLLKLIVGTTQPTQGTIQVGGRIAALLELGMGFHAEFSGRQNVYMSGQILGLSSEQISALLPDIQSFAEIGDYLDQPLRTYSSGMQVRLAFSVATAIRPEILIVDEALAVGDAYFQHKSFERIRKFRDAGTTLLFVSHSPGAVKTLCNRALLLDEGLAIRDGSPDEVLDYYNALIAKQAETAIRQIEGFGGRLATRSGNQQAEILGVDIVDRDQSVRAILQGSTATIRVHALVHEAIKELTVGILIRDRLGNDVFGTNSWHHDQSLNKLQVGQRISAEFIISAMNLGIGNYSLTVALHGGSAHISQNYDWWDRALVFQVSPSKLPRAVGSSYLSTLVEMTAYPSPSSKTN